MKKAILSATSDLSTDQRVHRSAMALQKMGYEVLVIGRKKRNSTDIPPRSYLTKRFSPFFERGLFFYAEFHIRLLLFLLSQKATILYANDLDTLLPNYIRSLFGKSVLIYDSHEYFTGVPELENRPIVREVWGSVESLVLPRLKTMITVSKSIADLYESEFGIRAHVIRNVPMTQAKAEAKTKSDFGIDEEKQILLYQGSGINIDRGMEEMVEAMQFIEGAVLIIAGRGDVLEVLKEKTKQLKLSDKIIFTGTLSPDELRCLTPMADIGLSIDKDTNFNYRYSLPNKLFDYIHAGVPVIASPLPEIKKIIDAYSIGAFIPSHKPKLLAEFISGILSNESLRGVWRYNCRKAASELCWEMEEVLFMDIITKATEK